MRRLTSGPLLALALLPLPALAAPPRAAPPAPAPAPTAAPAPAPAASRAAAEVPLPPPPELPRASPALVVAARSPAPEEPAWSLIVGAAQGHWADTGARDAAPASDFTAALAWRPAPRHQARLDLGGQRYRRSYQPAAGGPVAVDENRWSAGAAYGYEVLQASAASPWRVEAELSAGWLRFDDAAVITSAFPVGGAARLVRDLSGQADVALEAGWRTAAGATDPGDASVHGRLKSLAGYGLAAGWHVAGGHRVEVGYRGELLTFEHATRVAHLVGLKVGLGL